MVYEELSIPAIQKEWEKGFSSRFSLFNSVRERDHALEVMLKNQDSTHKGKMNSVTLKIFVKSDTDTEQMKFGLG